MSTWPSTKARRVLAALQRIGWQIKRSTGSHRILSRPGWPDTVFSFHDDEEIGPRMLSRMPFRSPRLSRAHFLLLSLEEGADADAESVWDAELARRMDEIQTGKDSGEPAEKVFVELREKYS